MADLRQKMRYLNAYDMHKLLINEYVVRRPGDTDLIKRDISKDRNDYHVIRDNHKFIWNENDTTDSWEQQFAKRYYDKLFKEYCIADLTLYKENKIALRWRIEKEVINGKGQFTCGNKKCNDEMDLRTWEVNFGYVESGEKMNALVKIRLCPDCSRKLNYHTKKREVKRLKVKKYSRKENHTNGNSKDRNETEIPDDNIDGFIVDEKNIGDSPWEKHKPEEVKSREEEMEDYLQELLI